MNGIDGNWKTFTARALVLGVVVFGAVKLAVADPGGPSSPDALTFAGVLRTATGLPFVGTTTLTFVFRKVGDGGAPTEVCRVTTDPINVPDGGAFSTQVLMDPTRCPRSLFDGSAIIYDVLQAGEMIVSAVQVTPVPYARFADQAGVNNDCPAGYTHDTMDTTVRGGAGVILCRRGRDEVVRVGDGASAFWIDRYESTVWSSREGGGAVPANIATDDLPTMGLPKNGQWTSTSPAGTRPRPSWFAVSARGDFSPSSLVTWFQANALCRASGKRLPSGDEWLSAAQGTPDDASLCMVALTPGGSRTRGTREGDACSSIWGAQDMIGNLIEWTGEWFAGGGQGVGVDFTDVQVRDGGARPTLSPSFVEVGGQTFGDTYGGDGVFNVNGFVFRAGGGSPQSGLPAAGLRGGNLTSTGNTAGVFNFAVNTAPSSSHPTVGFRCVIPR